MLRKYFNKKKINEKDLMLQSIVGIGDILSFEINRNNNPRIKNSLKKLFELVSRLFDIKKSDPNRFLNLILSQEYFDLHSQNEENAQFNISIYSEKYTVGFTTIIDQIIRVYKKAVEVNNLEIARDAIYVLNKILRLLSTDIENDLFIQQILKQANIIGHEAIKKDDSLIFDRVISLYKETVFDYYNKFEIQYLKKFDGYFFSIAKSVISENKSELFNDLVSTMMDGLHSDLGNKELWDYGHLLLEQDFNLYDEIDKAHHTEDKLKELDQSSKYINSTEALESWLSEFNDLKNIIEVNLSQQKINKAKELEISILNAIQNQFKLNNLRNLFVSIGAFCLFKKRVKFVRLLWNYKQPDDADATWIGHDIIPENLNDLMTVYFDLMDKDVSFFVGHHGSNKYVKNYFLLLLCRLLQNIRKDTDQKYTTIKLYHLPDLDVFKLSNLAYKCDDLIASAKKLMTDEKMLLRLGFEAIEDLFNQKVIPFIEHIKAEANKQIAAKHCNFSISQNKVEEFKNKFVEKFYELATLRDILTNYCKAYKYLENAPSNFKKADFGLNVIEDKAAFFETWHIHFSDWQTGFARSLAAGEDKNLFEKIISKCQKVTTENIEEILVKCDSLSDVIILTSGLNVWKFFDKNKGFKAGWRNDVEKLKIKGFKGWFEYKGYQLPVFAVSNTGHETAILILEKSKLGTLCQYSPLAEKDDSSLRRDVFYINVSLLTERTDLLEKFKNDPPEWLQDKGDTAAQNTYMQQRVIIEIYEKFEFVTSENFVGYKWELQLAD